MKSSVRHIYPIWTRKWVRRLDTEVINLNFCCKTLSVGCSSVFVRALLL